MTADSASVSVRLDSSEAKAPFIGWEAYCAEEVKSDSSSTTEYVYSDEGEAEAEGQGGCEAEAEGGCEAEGQGESRPKID